MKERGACTVHTKHKLVENKDYLYARSQQVINRA